jgi:hypothetical protein
VELLLILRPLWYRRGLLAIGVLAAVAIAIAFGRNSGATAPSAAAAFAGVRLDTPRSQLVDATPEGADTLSWRAYLMLHLMPSDEWKHEVAQRLGVGFNELDVIDGSFATPLVPTDYALRIARAASGVAAPYVLAMVPGSSSQPLMSIAAYARSPAAARKLVEAAIAVLASHASSDGLFESKILSGGGILTSDGKLHRQPFVVVPVGSVQVMSVAQRSLPLKALAGAMFVLLLWTGFVLLLGPSSRIFTRPRAVAHPS